MTRLEQTKEIFQTALTKLHTDRQYFSEFLKYSGRAYKIPAPHAVSLFESNPKATILADFDTWKKYGNSVMAGEHSIAALSEDGRHLKHYFDISQTTAASIPFQWSINQDIVNTFLKKEEEISGNNYRSLASYIGVASAKQIENNSEKLLSRFSIDDADKKQFLNSVNTMVMAVIAARCEYKSNYHYKTPNVPNLAALDMMKSKEETMALCSIVQQNAKVVLLKMEKSITQIINIQRMEERQNGRASDETVNRRMEQEAPQARELRKNTTLKSEKQSISFS